jgi:DNA excision repair protein ERCC-4
MKRLESDAVKMAPKKVTTDYSIPERQRLYLDGGVLFVTTRIMVVDMLTDRMPMCEEAQSYNHRNLRTRRRMY